MNVRIDTLPEQKIIKVRQTGPYSESAGRAWKLLCGWAAPRDLFTQATQFIGIGHDDPSVTAPENIRYDAAITVSVDVAAEPPVEFDILPGGEHAVCTHKGPYDRLEDAYKAVMGQWLPQSGREFRGGLTFEVYRNNPDTTPPEQLLTDIHIPLK